MAEMKTGEGKTLTATAAAAYLNALGRQGRAHHHGERIPRAARLRGHGEAVSEALGHERQGYVTAGHGIGPGRVNAEARVDNAKRRGYTARTSLMPLAAEVGFRPLCGTR